MKLPFANLVAISLLATAPLLVDHPKPTPDPDKDPPRFADTVDVELELPAVPPSSTTALKFPVPVQELPLSVSVIPRRLLWDQDAYVLSDGLKNASGINVGTGFGIFDFWVVRCFPHSLPAASCSSTGPGSRSRRSTRCTTSGRSRS